MFKTVNKDNLKKYTYTILLEESNHNEFNESDEYKKGVIVKKDFELFECLKNCKKGFKEEDWKKIRSLKTTKVIIQEPDFEKLSTAMQVLMDLNLSGTNRLNLIGAGKIIFETCTVEYDEIIETPAMVKRLISFCMTLATDFVMPEITEIKKN